MRPIALSGISKPFTGLPAYYVVFVYMCVFVQTLLLTFYFIVACLINILLGLIGRDA